MNEANITVVREKLTNIFSAGVVGAGGAGFPTHVKLSGNADTIILNGAECEPLLHKDKELLYNYTDQILEGLAIGAQLTGATNIILGIKHKYAELIDHVHARLHSGMRIEGLPDAYPSGDEQTLVYQTTGRIIPPGKIPLNVSCVVMNVETAFNTAAANNSQPVIYKYITVTGAVHHPVSVRVPVGATLADCVALAGGVTVDNPAYVVGGVMMGSLAPSLQTLVTKTTGGLIVLPEDHIVVRQMKRQFEDARRIGRAACDQCSQCTELCPRYLLGHPVEPHRAMRSLIYSSEGQASVPGSQFCCDCNLCTRISCPEGLDPRRIMSQNKQSIMAAGTRWTDAPVIASRAGNILPNRRTPTAKLMNRLNLRAFDIHADLWEPEVMLDRVGIQLKQHVGAPCVSVVAPGQKVVAGQIVGAVPVKDEKPALGAPVHASINGIVDRIENGIVWINASTDNQEQS